MRLVVALGDIAVGREGVVTGFYRLEGGDRVVVCFGSEHIEGPIQDLELCPNVNGQNYPPSGEGWRASRAGLPLRGAAEDATTGDVPAVVFFCPACAEVEFGD